MAMKMPAVADQLVAGRRRGVGDADCGRHRCFSSSAWFPRAAQAWANTRARLPANGGALGTRVRAATEHAIGVVEGDALGMAHHRIIGFDELHVMALRPQLRNGLRGEAPLQPQRLTLARLLDAVNPARLLDGCLGVAAIAAEAGIALQGRLRLAVAAHPAADHSGLSL